MSTEDRPIVPVLTGATECVSEYTQLKREEEVAIEALARAVDPSNEQHAGLRAIRSLASEATCNRLLVEKGMPDCPGHINGICGFLVLKNLDTGTEVNNYRDGLRNALNLASIRGSLEDYETRRQTSPTKRAHP